MRAPRILLIRADDDTHHELRRRLERSGCRVWEAATQPQAVHLAQRLEPDLLVQEELLPAADRPRELDRLMAAIALLAGPLPAHAHRAVPLGASGWPSPRRMRTRSRHRPLAAAGW